MHNNSTKQRTIVASQASDTLHGSQMAPQLWRNGKVRMAPQLTTRGRPPYRKRPVKSVICSTCRTTNKKTHHKIKIGSRALMISRIESKPFLQRKRQRLGWSSARPHKLTKGAKRNGSNFGIVAIFAKATKPPRPADGNGGRQANRQSPHNKYDNASTQENNNGLGTAL